MADKVSGVKEVWISYKDDNDSIVSGFVILHELTATSIRFETNRSIITLPIHRLLKLKERKEYG